MSKDDSFNELWVKYDYCMMGYGYDQLYNSMTLNEIKRRLKEEKENA